MRDLPPLRPPLPPRAVAAKPGRPAHVLVAGFALLVFVAGLALGPMAESDLFFRVEAGRQILARHGLPGVNLYSFTYPDHSDVDTSWLFEVGAAVLHARGGFPALVLAKTAVLVATFAAAFLLCLRCGAGPAASALALAAAAFAGRDRFVERPPLFSLAGVVLVLAVSGAARTQRARRGGRAASPSRRSRASCCGPTCTRACSWRPRCSGSPRSARASTAALARGASRGSRRARRSQPSRRPPDGAS